MTARSRLAFLATHPVQYHAPLYRALAAHPGIELEVLFAHRQDAAGQAKAGYGVPFEWDLPILDGYRSRFLHNRAARPDVSRFGGCHTPEVAEILSSERFQALVIHGWGSRCYIQAALAARRLGLPVLVRGDSTLGTPRGLALRAAKRALHPLLLRMFDAFLVVGRRAREYYLHYQVPERRLFESPHCVDNQHFARGASEWRPRRAACLSEHGLSPNRPTVGFVGRLVPMKRPLDVVEALGAVPSKARPQLLVAGDGPLRADMERRAASLGVAAVFVGFVNQSRLPGVYALLDALVLPSDGGETWGLVVNEAMAAGCPAIVSEAVGCRPDLVLEGRTGLSFPLGDRDRLAAILQRVGEDPGLVRRMGAAAELHIERNSATRAAAGVVRALEACRLGATR